MDPARFYTVNNYWNGAPAIAGTEEAVICDTSNGVLYYDANGSSASGLTLAGILKTHPTVTAADIVLI